MKLAIPALVAVTLSSAAWAQPAATPGNEQELINMEANWSKAIVAKDPAALNKIMAADWHGQNQLGVYSNRDTVVKALTDGTDSVSAMTNHDVHVRFVGADLAIVQGEDTETSTHKGKPSSGTYSWTDIFQRRDGQWVAIASQNTPVTPDK